MMKQRRLLTLAFCSFVLVVFFQNCGDRIDLQALKVPEVTQTSANLTAQGCVNSIKMAPEKTKFVFVVDLSLSNFGDFYESKFLFNGSYFPGYWFFNATQGTDNNGERFESIKDFVNTCGNSSNLDYAIIGFSAGAGEIVQQGGFNKLECKKKFTNATGLIAQLDIMKQVQTQEFNYYSQFIEPNKPLLAENDVEIAPLLFKETNYVSAADCLTSTIEADIISPSSEASNYQVFYLSDGEAKAESTGCEAPEITDKVACYTDKMDKRLSYLMKLSSAKSKPVRIHSLYYTRNGAQNLAIESYMNYISAIDQTSTPINLGSFKNSSNQDGENPFCKLLAVDKSIVYRTNKIFAVNPLTVKVGSKKKADSDADGITDEDEVLFGSSPRNPRSLADGVLDGICKMIGNASLCEQARNQIICNPVQINSFNISDCDIKILKLDKIAVRPELIGIDSDNDGLPDYIEILKGTSPLNSDSYLDMDGDGLTNLQEISEGLDPFTPDTGEEPVIKTQSVFREQINGCTSGGWELNVSDLGGNPGRNDLILFFRTESKNTQGLFEYRNHITGYDLNRNQNGSLSIKLDRDFIAVDDFELVSNGGSQ